MAGDRRTGSEIPLDCRSRSDPRRMPGELQVSQPLMATSTSGLGDVHFYVFYHSFEHAIVLLMRIAFVYAERFTDCRPRQQPAWCADDVLNGQAAAIRPHDTRHTNLGRALNLSDAVR